MDTECSPSSVRDYYKCNSKEKNTIGLMVDAPVKIDEEVEAALSSSFSFIATPLFNPRTGVAFSDIAMNSSAWSYRVLGRLQGLHTLADIGQDVGDSSGRFKETVSFLEKQMDFMSHTKVFGVLIEVPEKRGAAVHVARLINRQEGKGGNLFLSFSIQDRDWKRASTRSNSEGEDMSSDAWKDYSTIRSLSRKKVMLALEVSADLPSVEEQRRWAGEGIRFLILSTSVFQTNKKGFPVLSKALQTFVSDIMLHNQNVCFIIKGPGEGYSQGYRAYSQYLDHFFIPKVQSLRETHLLLEGTEDVLQVPLQPLSDNLESSVYEIFEKDPVKYSVYREAIKEALKDRMSVPDLTVLVVGAGRGPLVTACIAAAESLAKDITVYVVEKNVNAIPTLCAWKEIEWVKHKVVTDLQIFCSDMRHFVPPKKADIVISELLGSFGDNELSPECLDGVHGAVKADAISIPESYTSFIHPIMSQRLHRDILSLESRTASVRNIYDTPYIVNLHNFYSVSQPKELFSFTHRSLSCPVKDNTRYRMLSFQNNPVEYLVTGFAGYFETILYGSHKLSIVPESYSKGMFSWFPIYFPLQSPVLLKPNTNLDVHFWRLVDDKRVWYEWCVTNPVVTNIANNNASSSHMSLIAS